MSEWTDKVAVITGAGQGIGLDIALTLAKEGVHVVLASRSENAHKSMEKVKKKFPENKGFSMIVDVSKGDQVKALVDKTVQAFGRLDIMVNNAGIEQPVVTSTMDMPEEAVDKLFDVNFKGVFFGCKYAARQMIKQKQGAIINMGSGHGKTGFKNYAPYSASKAAVIVFTQALALELAEYGVRANTICPTIIETDMLKRAWTSECKERGITLEQQENTVKQFIPMKRFGTGKDIAGTVRFLASDAASYITGIALNVAGGLELH